MAILDRIALLSNLRQVDFRHAAEELQEKIAEAEEEWKQIDKDHETGKRRVSPT